MCGISGYVKFKGEVRDEQLITAMVTMLHHRGPDNQSVYVNGRAALGHARLSILDLSAAGNQPMHSDDGRYVIVYNGEIYNFKELREDLYQRGFSFHTGTDTEVILKLYQLQGADAFKKLNGIFALAIWDTIAQKLILARDRFGVKPLYFYQSNDVIVFASEIKAILASGFVEATVSIQALHEFLYYGNAIGSETLFSNIYKLSPGHYLTAGADGVNTAPYWTIKEIPVNNNVDDEAAVIQHIRQLTEDAVKRQLVSDVPVGVFLSGGIDSSCVTAFASKHYNGKLNTYSCGFDFDIGVNELPKAKKVAEYFGTDHHEMFIEGKNLPDIVHQLVWQHDEPFSDAANIPLYLLTKALKGSPKVILQGDGGDEIFGGYRRYNILDQLTLWKMGSSAIKPFFSLLPKKEKVNQLKRFVHAITQPNDAMRMAMLLTVDTLYENTEQVFSAPIQHQLRQTDAFKVYKEVNKSLNGFDVVQKMLWTDTQILLPQTFLEKVDKPTMANSIEVRVPLLDNELTSYVMGLPSAFKVQKGEKKWALKKALRGVVPDEILDAPKLGFSVPYINWLRGPLKQTLLDTINDDAVKQSSLFNYELINQKIKEHDSRQKDNGFLLWKLMNLAIWMKRYNVKINAAA